jgi:hypothetical protein
VVIGIEPEWTKIVVDGIAKTGKPVLLPVSVPSKTRFYWRGQ